MTTVICKPSAFCAIDSLWACDLGFSRYTNHLLNKYIIVDDEINLFCGDEIPILLTQAYYSGVITEGKYLELMDELEPDERMNITVLNEHDGTLTSYDGSYYEHLIHDGSGGYFAAQFYHYATAISFRSDLGCNIQGAIQYACHKDPDHTDKPIIRKTWATPNIDELNRITDNYLRYLRRRISKLKEKVTMASLKSTLRTSANRDNASRIDSQSVRLSVKNRKERMTGKTIKAGSSSGKDSVTASMDSRKKSNSAEKRQG